MKRSTRKSWGWLGFLLLVGCWDRVDYLEVGPKILVFKQKNNEIWLKAQAMSRTGVPAPKARPTWSVENPSIASVDPSGRLTPVKSGHTQVIAKYRDVEATLPVDVLLAEKITVTPSPLSLEEGGPSMELQVKVLDYLGRELKDRVATFKSLDKEVLSMGQNAAFPVNAGKTQLVVQVGDVTERVDVVVAEEKKHPAKK